MKIAVPTEVHQKESEVIKIFVAEGETPLIFYKNLQLFLSNEKGPEG